MYKCVNLKNYDIIINNKLKHKNLNIKREYET